jgi:acylphosphatase
MTHNDHNRVHLRITGQVQGVGFRWFVVSCARRLGLPGWVRNNPDGSVELEAAGAARDLAILRDRLAVGPPGARVERVAELPSSTAPLPDRFAITH